MNRKGLSEEGIELEFTTTNELKQDLIKARPRKSQKLNILQS